MFYNVNLTIYSPDKSQKMDVQVNTILIVGTTNA